VNQRIGWECDALDSTALILSDAYVC
jgi:hypothetical protein